MTDIGFDEQFLILSLVRAIQDEFDWMAENEPVDRDQPLAMVAHLEAILADPARRDAYIRSKNEELSDDDSSNGAVTRSTIEDGEGYQWESTTRASSTCTVSSPRRPRCRVTSSLASSSSCAATRAAIRVLPGHTGQWRMRTRWRVPVVSVAVMAPS